MEQYSRRDAFHHRIGLFIQKHSKQVHILIIMADKIHSNLINGTETKYQMEDSYEIKDFLLFHFCANLSNNQNVTWIAVLDPEQDYCVEKGEASSQRIFEGNSISTSYFFSRKSNCPFSLQRTDFVFSKLNVSWRRFHQMRSSVPKLCTLCCHRKISLRFLLDRRNSDVWSWCYNDKMNKTIIQYKFKFVLQIKKSNVSLLYLIL